MTPTEVARAIADMKLHGVTVEPNESGGFNFKGAPGQDGVGWAYSENLAWAWAWGYFVTFGTESN